MKGRGGDCEDAQDPKNDGPWEHVAVTAVAELSLLSALARLLEYPGTRFEEDLAAARRVLDECFPECLAEIEEFAGAMKSLTPEEREELFTRTFDINPICCLEVGWHLFGDRYERGAFLVKMRGVLRDHDIPESTELSDHLSSVLMAVDRMGEPAAGELAAQTLKAVEKMRVGFEGKDASAAGPNPYGFVLKIVSRALERRIPGEKESSTHGD